ncbi:hypothetical protein ACMDCR_24880 [Labrys okinawensis]|uniref:hypothetical protein n=1 Tax=Labrys okinawensis TaxID=346911 RepID=UPI0039BD5232
MTEHLDLSELTPFAARYLLAENARIHVGSGYDRKVLKLIEAHADCLGSEDGGLDQSFTQLADKVRIHCDDFRGKITPGLSDKLKTLTEHLDKRRCSYCKPKDNGESIPACDRHNPTYGAVSAPGGGNCIQPLMKRFASLSNWVESLWCALPYRNSMPSLPIKFATSRRTFEDSQAIVQRFSVSGYAQSLPLAEEGKYFTKVGLEIRDESFGWQQFNLLSYILLHEILCHAYQSLDKPDIRLDAEPSDPWSEGWMDRLAFKLTVQWLNLHRHTPLQSESEVRNGGSEVRYAMRQIEDLHNARYGNDVSMQGDLDLSTGREIFDDVVQSYSDKLNKLPFSRHPITIFSLRLNAITRDPTLRVKDLVNIQFMLESDPRELHNIIAAFNAADGNNSALSILERLSG